MATATFADLIAARDITLPDDSQWTTPSTDPCPNGDHATQAAVDVAEGSYATSDDFALPWGVSDWSIELWARWTASVSGSVAPILARTPSGMGTSPAEWQLCQAASAGPELRLRITVADPSLPWAQPAITATGGAWFHLVWTLNTSLGSGAVGGRTCKTYKNGILDATTSLPSTSVGVPTLSGPRLTFGNHQHLAPTFMELAKLAIYHRELTLAEILDHYTVMTT